MGLRVLPVPLLATVVVAQRRWVTGRVLRTDGSRWAGAEVILHSLSWRTPPTPEFQHRMHILANDHGLFRAQVLVGRSYVAWSTSAVRDGTDTSTQVASAISAGTPVELKELDQRLCILEVTQHGSQTLERSRAADRRHVLHARPPTRHAVRDHRRCPLPPQVPVAHHPAGDPGVGLRRSNGCQRQ